MRWMQRPARWRSSLEETQRSIVDLARSWREGNTPASAGALFQPLFQPGLRYSRGTKFSEPLQHVANEQHAGNVGPYF